MLYAVQECVDINSTATSTGTGQMRDERVELFDAFSIWFYFVGEQKLCVCSIRRHTSLAADKRTTQK